MEPTVDRIVIDRIAEVLSCMCPTDRDHSRQVAGMVAEGLGLTTEVRGAEGGAADAGRQFRYVTEWFDE